MAGTSAACGLQPLLQLSMWQGACLGRELWLCGPSNPLMYELKLVCLKQLFICHDWWRSMYASVFAGAGLSCSPLLCTAGVLVWLACLCVLGGAFKALHTVQIRCACICCWQLSVYVCVCVFMGKRRLCASHNAAQEVTCRATTLSCVVLALKWLVQLQLDTIVLYHIAQCMIRLRWSEDGAGWCVLALKCRWIMLERWCNASWIIIECDAANVTGTGVHQADADTQHPGRIDAVSLDQLLVHCTEKATVSAQNGPL